MKKENKGLIILVVILLIAAVVVGAFVGYKRAAQNDKKNDIDSKSVAKLDDSKDYVYDADYTGVYKNQYTEYNRCTDTSPCIIKLSDLKVPYINIDSYYAGHTNGELEALYKDRAENFDKCAVVSHDCYDSITYKSYKYNNILSVVVIYGIAFANEYKTYSFDLKTGNEITYDEMITRLGYDKNTLLDKEKDVIKKEMDESNSFNYDLTKTCGNMDSPKNCYDIAFKMLEDSINDNSIAYFADENGKLNIVAVPYTNLSQASHYAKYVFTIEK